MSTGVTATDVRDMAIVHETFRRLYAESAGLVRANPTPSAQRVTFLADHISFGLEMLHHHHESEDELLYPLLVERVPEQAATTEKIDAEHEEIAVALGSAQEACRAWRTAPSAETGEALAAALDTLNEITQPHLDHEEQVIVPLAAQHLSQAEWEAVGEHSRANIPKDKMAVAFGMITEPLSKSDADYMRSSLPAPVRLLYPILIGRAWTKYADTLRNGT
jgi:hemerythrin-like domain-containing protein